jgi:hypothetical protein
LSKADRELSDCLRRSEEHGSDFLRAIAEARFASGIKDYALLRPVLST